MRKHTLPLKRSQMTWRKASYKYWAPFRSKFSNLICAYSCVHVHIIWRTSQDLASCCSLSNASWLLIRVVPVLIICARQSQLADSIRLLHGLMQGLQMQGCSTSNIELDLYTDTGQILKGADLICQSSSQGNSAHGLAADATNALRIPMQVCLRMRLCLSAAWRARAPWFCSMLAAGPATVDSCRVAMYRCVREAGTVCWGHHAGLLTDRCLLPMPGSTPVVIVNLMY